MEIRTYIDTVLKRWWLIGLLVVIASSFGYFYSKMQTPLYAATATIAIDPSASVQIFPFLGQGSGGGFSLRDPLTSLVAGYQQYLSSRTFATLAIKRLNLAMAPDDFAALVALSLVRDTNFMQVSVMLPDAAESQRITNGVVTLILDQLDEKESTGPKAEIQRLIGYYRPKVESLRQQRDSVESDPAIPSRDKMQLLATLDSRLTPMEELYLKLTASLTDPSSAGTIAIPGLSQLPNVSVNADAVQIMDWAELPTDPVSGGELRILAMAVFSALLVGVGLAFLMEYMDERVKTPRRLEQALGLAPMAVIGTIPSRGPRQGDQQFAGLYPSSNSMSNGSGNHASSRRLNAKLVAASNPLHPTAEDFRFARTMVLQRGSAAASQVLLVTSWGSGEGKSTTLANLAVTLAQGGQRVVVVDADLRRPTLHRLFDVSNEAGLSAVLAGEGNADRWLQSTPIDNLRILTAGLPKHSPADMLSSPLLAKVLEELKGYAQTVLIDAPALSVAADALQVARGVDGVLLVADSRKTTSSALTEAKVRLELVGANLRGVILTRFSEKRDKRYYRASAHKRALTPRLGEYLIKSNLLTADQLQEALKRQGEMASQGTRKRIGEVLVEEGYITSEALAEASRRQEDGV